MSVSPYDNIPPEDWPRVTRELIDAHPLTTKELVDAVRDAWTAIFNSTMGKGARIGTDISPSPQIMGFFLHELIPFELATRYQGVWRTGRTGQEKDIVYVPDSHFSIEVKTSSNPNKIFGNRSYAQETSSTGKKAKSGYYLAVNFEKFIGKDLPEIVLIRFGWLDSTDWVGQAAATGQQSRLPKNVEDGKLLVIYRKLRKG